MKTMFNLRLSLGFAISDLKRLLLKVKVQYNRPPFSSSVELRIERWELTFCLLNE